MVETRSHGKRGVGRLNLDPSLAQELHTNITTNSPSNSTNSKRDQPQRHDGIGVEEYDKGYNSSSSSSSSSLSCTNPDTGGKYYGEGEPTAADAKDCDNQSKIGTSGKYSHARNVRRRLMLDEGGLDDFNISDDDTLINKLVEQQNAEDNENVNDVDDEGNATVNDNGDDLVSTMSDLQIPKENDVHDEENATVNDNDNDTVDKMPNLQFPEGPTVTCSSDMCCNNLDLI